MTDISAREIRRLLPKNFLKHLSSIEVFDQIDSTNSYLLDKEEPSSETMHVVIAGCQSAGRGRRGRQWYSPRSGLYLSVSYPLTNKRNSGSLTLAIGSALADLLFNIGVNDIRLKWPNDLIVNEKKLGGILIESRDTKKIICGIGININFPDKEFSITGIDINPIDLKTILFDVPSIEQLAKLLIPCLYDAITGFFKVGFSAYQEKWTKYDYLVEKEVVVNQSEATICGTYKGIDKNGSLLLQNNNGLHHIISGSVRLRKKR